MAATSQRIRQQARAERHTIVASRSRVGRPFGDSLRGLEHNVKRTDLVPKRTTGRFGLATHRSGIYMGNFRKRSILRSKRLLRKPPCPNTEALEIPYTVSFGCTASIIEDASIHGDDWRGSM